MRRYGTVRRSDRENGEQLGDGDESVTEVPRCRAAHDRAGGLLHLVVLDDDPDLELVGDGDLVRDTAPLADALG